MARKKPPSFQFYTKEWLASSKTRRMTLAERGLYVELLAWQFEDGSVPNDPEEVARMVGAPIEVIEACWDRVAAMFENRENGLVNARLETARKEFDSYRKAKSRAGKIGNEVRWKRRAANRQPNTEQEDTSDRSAIANASPASASASASKRSKSRDLKPLGPDPESDPLRESLDRMIATAPSAPPEEHGVTNGKAKTAGPRFEWTDDDRWTRVSMVILQVWPRDKHTEMLREAARVPPLGRGTVYTCASDIQAFMREGTYEPDAARRSMIEAINEGRTLTTAPGDR